MLTLLSWKWRYGDRVIYSRLRQGQISHVTTSCSGCHRTANINKGNAFPFTLWFQTSLRGMLSNFLTLVLCYFRLLSILRQILFGFHPEFFKEKWTFTFFFLTSQCWFFLSIRSNNLKFLSTWNPVSFCN